MESASQPLLCHYIVAGGRLRKAGRDLAQAAVRSAKSMVDIRPSTRRSDETLVELSLIQINLGTRTLFN
jgi:hypothetical protein